MRGFPGMVLKLRKLKHLSTVDRVIDIPSRIKQRQLKSVVGTDTNGSASASMMLLKADLVPLSRRHPETRSFARNRSLTNACPDALWADTRSLKTRKKAGAPWRA